VFGSLPLLVVIIFASIGLIVSVPGETATAVVAIVSVALFLILPYFVGLSAFGGYLRGWNRSLDMPFDDYLCEPVESEDVRAVVDQQRLILAYQTLGEYFSAEAKREVLEAELSSETRRGYDGDAENTERAEHPEGRARRLLDDDRLLHQFEQIDRENL